MTQISIAIECERCNRSAEAPNKALMAGLCKFVGSAIPIIRGDAGKDALRKRPRKFETDAVKLPPCDLSGVRARAANIEFNVLAQVQAAIRIINPAPAARKVGDLNRPLIPALGAIGTRGISGHAIVFATLHNVSSMPYEV